MRHARVSVLGATLIGLACRSGTGGPETGSESHFLTACETVCPGGLSCLCGVCTKSCSDRAECLGLASRAECTPVASRSAEAACTTPSVPAFCDLPCLADADCAALGAAHRCQSGYCRLPPTCPPTLLRPGDNEGTVQVEETLRSYVVRLPASYTGVDAVPLVLDFHPLGSDPSVEANNSGYRELAEQEGFIVAWPQGIDSAWNIGPCCTMSRTVDDLGFSRALVEQLRQQACIDSRRIYAVGFSMGGGMAFHLACNAADLFAGVAPSGFDLLVESQQPCAPVRPVTVIAFRGTADSLVPYEGGDTKPPNGLDVTVTFLGAVGTFQRWAELDRCSGSPSEPDANGCSTYSECEGGAQVTLCTTEGGGQAWGSAELAWSVLEAHPLP